MPNHKPKLTTQIQIIAILVASATLTMAQQSAPAKPQVSWTDVSADQEIAFRIKAPNAKSVKLESPDIPNLARDTELNAGEAGTWTITIGPVPAGAYRYVFNIDGARVADPQNTATSESNGYFWSLIVVPGSDVMDLKDVPHGAVAEVAYYSKSLKRFRRMHVYTPPGYEAGDASFPAFYLLHGAGDCDDAWTTVGRANVILDNLIAAGRAEPMVVVMPAGHTGPFHWGQPMPTPDPFLADFTQDVLPYVEAHYRVIQDRAHRAVAGLSMGGWQSLNLMVGDMNRFAYVGVFSSGILERRDNQKADTDATANAAPTWEERNAAALDNAAAKQGLQLLWFATGKDDFLLNASKQTVETLRKHGFRVFFKETAGGHTWLNWRDHLQEFAPQLFKPVPAEKADNRE